MKLLLLMLMLMLPAGCFPRAVADSAPNGRTRSDENSAPPPSGRITATRSGLDQAVARATQQFRRKVARETFADVRGREKLKHLGSCRYKLRGMKLDGLGQLTSSLKNLAGRAVRWSVTLEWLRVTGSFEYKCAVISDHGNFDVRLSDVSLLVDVAFGETSGRPNVSAGAVESHVGSARVRISSGGTSWLYHVFRGTVDRHVRVAARRKLHDVAERLVNGDVNRFVTSLTLLMPTFDGRMLLNCSMTGPPKIGPDDVTSLHRVEFLWPDGSPSYPGRPSALPVTSVDRHLILTGSQFTLESLCWLAQKHSVLEFNVSRDQLPAPLRQQFNTSCENCVRLVPGLDKLFPNMWIFIAMKSTAVPVVRLSPPAGVQLNFTGSGTLFVTSAAPAARRKTFVFSFDCDLSVGASLFVNGSKILARRRDKVHFRARLTKSVLTKFAQRQLDFFVDFLVNNAVNVLLRNLATGGYQLPTVEGVRFVDPVIRVHDGHVDVGVNLEPDS